MILTLTSKLSLDRPTTVSWIYCRLTGLQLLPHPTSRPPPPTLSLLLPPTYPCPETQVSISPAWLCFHSKPRGPLPAHRRPQQLSLLPYRSLRVINMEQSAVVFNVAAETSAAGTWCLLSGLGLSQMCRKWTDASIHKVSLHVGFVMYFHVFVLVPDCCLTTIR